MFVSVRVFVAKQKYYHENVREIFLFVLAHEAVAIIVKIDYVEVNSISASTEKIGSQTLVIVNLRPILYLFFASGVVHFSYFLTEPA